jgi:hypothetical protein
VIFWTVGSKEPSGKFKRVHDPGRSQLGLQGLPDAPRSITLQMAQGLPVSAAHSVTGRFAPSRSGAGCSCSAASRPISPSRRWRRGATS